MTLDSSFTILEASFRLIYNAYSIGITYDNCGMFELQATRVSARMILCQLLLQQNKLECLYLFQPSLKLIPMGHCKVGDMVKLLSLTRKY